MSCHAVEQIDRAGYGHTWVHRVDARLKTILAIVFVLCVASFPKHTVAALIPFFAVPVFLGIAGHVPWRPLGKILLTVGPLAILPGLLNPFFDTAPAVLAGSIAIHSGWLSLASIGLRFLLTMGLLLVLVSTTSFPGVLGALARFRVPQALIVQLSLLYRYVFVLIEEGEAMSRARMLRDPQRRLPRLETVKPMLTALLWRSLECSQRLYQVLRIRGFQGTWPAMNTAALPPHQNMIFCCVGLGWVIACRLCPVTQWLGNALARHLS